MNEIAEIGDRRHRRCAGLRRHACAAGKQNRKEEKDQEANRPHHESTYETQRDALLTAHYG
jgi:hypothetical protein